MRNFYYNKKGELTTQHIVILVILVTSFAIILFLIFRLDLGKVTNKEVCHNSVVMKSKSNLIGSLDCETTYICISGGGECEGYSDITKDVKLDDLNKARDEIRSIIAEEMADCWWMFGEGKVDYKSADWEGYHCAICSVIKFDSILKEKFNNGIFNYKTLYNYFNDTKKSNSQSYLQYLYKTDKIKEILNKNENLDLSEMISTKEKYSIFTGLNPNWPSADSFINSYIVKSQDLFSKTDCKVFDITKA